MKLSEIRQTVHDLTAYARILVDTLPSEMEAPDIDVAVYREHHTARDVNFRWHVGSYRLLWLRVGTDQDCTYSWMTSKTEKGCGKWTLGDKIPDEFFAAARKLGLLEEGNAVDRAQEAQGADLAGSTPADGVARDRPGGDAQGSPVPGGGPRAG